MATNIWMASVIIMMLVFIVPAFIGYRKNKSGEDQ